MSTFVLDASGLLAYLLDEEGAAKVEEALASPAAISAANLAETLSKIAERGGDPGEVVSELTERGLLGGLLVVEPLTEEDAITIAELRPLTKDQGLGLGDRACLSLGRRLDLPVMTADSEWVAVEEAVGVTVQAIR